jgi:hypothetical protein
LDIVVVLIFWAIAAIACVRGTAALVSVLMVSLSFGSFAVISPSVTAGLTLTPAPMLALILIGRVFVSLSGLNYLASLILKPSRMTLLLIFWVYATLATYFLPRFFYRQADIIPVRFEGVTTITLLEPTTQNISQLAYLSISIFAVLALACHFRDPDNRLKGTRALLYGAYAAIITGLLDFIAMYVPIGAFLEPFRTATYALLTDVEMFGGKRVVGLMPEASAYGSTCLALLSALYFFRHLLADTPARAFSVFAGLVGLLALTWLSTSSAAIVGLAILMMTAGANWVWRGVTASGGQFLNRSLAFEFWVVALTISLIAVATLIDLSIWNPVIEMLDDLIFSKSGSSSYEERNLWTSTSLNALYQTYGLGVGVGSTRTSNAIVAIFSNVGIFGGLLFFLFVICALIKSSGDGGVNDATAHAARWAYIAPFSAAALVGGSPDFGILNAWLFALAIAATSSVSSWARSVSPYILVAR